MKPKKKKENSSVSKKYDGKNIIIVANRPLSTYISQIILLGSVKRYNDIILRAVFKYAGTLDVLVERFKFFGLEELEERRIIEDTNLSTGEKLQVIEVLLEKIGAIRL